MPTAEGQPIWLDLNTADQDAVQALCEAGAGWRVAPSPMPEHGMVEMKVTVSIDVPSLEEGLRFFGDVFGFVETSRPHPGYAMLTSGEAAIGLLEKPADSSPAPGCDDLRRYDRHWTPVHVDFRVEDFEGTLSRALANGAKSEQIHRVPGFPPVAFCSDPFGHGFCIVGLTKL